MCVLEVRFPVPSLSVMRPYRGVSRSPELPLVLSTAGNAALCHFVLQCHCLLSQSSQFCSHNPLCFFSWCPPC
jgi:hypothetical protein